MVELEEIAIRWSYLVKKILPLEIFEVKELGEHVRGSKLHPHSSQYWR